MEQKIAGTNVTVRVDQAAAAVSIKMITDGLGKNGAVLRAGETYEVPQDNADWNVRLGRATYVQAEHDGQPSDAVKGLAPSVQGAPGAPAGTPTGLPAAVTLPDLDPETLTVADLKAALDGVSVTYDSGALKADLVKAYAKQLKAQAKA